MKVDFETLAAAITFIVNTAGVATLWWLLERSELNELKSDLGEAIKTNTSDIGYVKRLRRKLRWELVGWMLLLHVVNLGIYLALLAILLLGPQMLFSPSTAGALAEPLTPWEKVIYSVWLAISGLVYVARGVAPTLGFVALCVKAGRWLRTNERKAKNA